MKKILSIIFVSLLLSANAYSEIIKSSCMSVTDRYMHNMVFTISPNKKTVYANLKWFLGIYFLWGKNK